MSAHSTKLRLQATGEWIDAQIHDDLDVASLFNAESAWAPSRVRLVEQLLLRSVPCNEWPQSLHWDWARKAAPLHSILGNALSGVRLFGIEVGDEWQGLLLAECTGHRSRMEQPLQELVYVEYVETAPWNWPLPRVDQKPRYRAVGPQLFEMAIRWSKQIGFKGRVGLHSLPQAEEFYRDRCRMTDLELDRAYQNLRYFEMTQTQAENYLSRKRP